MVVWSRLLAEAGLRCWLFRAKNSCRAQFLRHQVIFAFFAFSHLFIFSHQNPSIH
jgi:hypothetical protein